MGQCALVIVLIWWCLKGIFLTEEGIACNQDTVDNYCEAVTDRLKVIQRIIQYENMRHVHFIVAGEHTTVWKSKLELDGSIIQYFHIHNELKELFKVLTDIQGKTLEFQRRFLNFIVLGMSWEVNDVMAKMREFDKDNNANLLLKHFSKWLLVPLHVADIVPNGFDNIAVVGCKQTRGHTKQISDVKTSANYKSCRIQTVLWEDRGQSLGEPMSLESLTNKSGSLELFPNVQRGLNGQNLRFTITEWRPYVIKTVTGNLTSFEGVCPDVIKILSAQFNFTCDFTEPEDGQWGQLENGSWTGQIGDVHRGLADMTGSWLGMDYYRVKDVDFSYTLQISPFAIVYLRPKDEHPLTYLVRQFRVDVYLYGLLALGGMILLISIIGVILPKNLKRPVLNHYLNSVKELSFLLISISLRQGISWTPGDITRRILLVSFWFYTIIMTSVYCGNLMAFRSVRRGVGPYESLSEMISNDDITFGFEGRSMLENILRLSDDRELTLLWQRITTTMQTDRSVVDTNRSKHVERLYTGNYAFIVDAMTLPLITRNDCTLLKLDKTFLASPYSFAFPKHSPLPKLFNKKLTELLDSGYIDRLAENWYPKTECRTEEERAKPMLLTDYLSAMIAAGVLVLLAGAVLAVECVLVKLHVHKPL